MNYIVLDLEWNQSSNQRDKEYGIPFEILEIGAVKLNENKEIIGKFDQLIKPQIYQTIHFITTKIIHIDKEELSNGKPFQEVAKAFLDWCGKDYIFCTWGTLDLTEFQRNLCYYGMDEISKGPLPFYDLQKFFSIAFEDGKIRRSLEFAVDYLNIEKDIPFHRAYSDAYYTAKVFAKIYNRDVEKYVSYDIFITPCSKKEEVHKIFPTYSKYITREFKEKAIALNDREVNSTRCYLCGRRAKKKIKWFSVNGKHYYSLSYCKRHGFLKGKIRMKKADDGDFYVIKTLKLITLEEAEDIRNKQDKLRKQRAEKRIKNKKEMT